MSCHKCKTTTCACRRGGNGFSHRKPLNPFPSPRIDQDTCSIMTTDDCSGFNKMVTDILSVEVYDSTPAGCSGISGLFVSSIALGPCRPLQLFSGDGSVAVSTCGEFGLNLQVQQGLSGGVPTPFISRDGIVQQNVPEGSAYEDHFLYGATGIDGPGARFYYNSSLSAFRVGAVNGTEWDEVNLGQFSLATGLDNQAIGQGSFASGQLNTASGDNSHIEGAQNNSGGVQSHAEGFQTSASGDQAHTEGLLTNAQGNQAHAEGNETQAVGANSHSEGFQSSTFGDNSHAEGNITVAFGLNSHAEGLGTTAGGINSHAEGSLNIAQGDQAHVEGTQNEAIGNNSHAEGAVSTAQGNQSHAEGANTTASGQNSHAEGAATASQGLNSHAEGFQTTAGGNHSHTEGQLTQTSDDNCHAEGLGTTAFGNTSHAEGINTTALGQASHSQGISTIAFNVADMAIGQATSTEHANTNGRRFIMGAFGTVSSSTTDAGTGIVSTNPGFYIANGISIAQPNIGFSITSILSSGSQNIAAGRGLIARGRQFIGSGGAGTNFIDGGGNADMAEFFEFADPEQHITGRMVCFDGTNKIRLAESNDRVLGAVSATAAFLSDYSEEWPGKYEKDNYGAPIIVDEFDDAYIGKVVNGLQDLGVTDFTRFVEIAKKKDKNMLKETVKGMITPSTKFTKEMFSLTQEQINSLLSYKDVVPFKTEKLSPKYDPSKTYVSRMARKEWAIIGLIGKLYVEDDGTCEVGSYAKVSHEGIVTHSDGTAKRDWYVMERKSINTIRILFR